MRSIPHAMVWELLYRGRWDFIIALPAAQFIPIGLLTMMRLGPVKLELTDQIDITLQLVTVASSIAALAGVVVSMQFDNNRLFTLPVRTSTLVAWRMFPSMILMFLLSLFGTFLLNRMYGLDWPLVGPALVSVVAVGAILAAHWYGEKSSVHKLYACLPAAILGVWFKSRYGPVFGMPTQSWKVVTPVEIATLLGFTALTYSLAIFGMARRRCDESSTSTVWNVSVEELAMNLSVIVSAAHTEKFQSRLEAQLCCEWRTKGWSLPLVVAFGLVLGLSIWSLFDRDPKELVGILIGGGILLSIIGMGGGLIHGNCGPNSSTFDIGHFLGTRPITNAELSWTVLKVAARSTLISWVIWASTAVAFIAVAIATGFPVTESFNRGRLSWWYLPATLLSCWISVGLMTSIALSGRAQLFSKFVPGTVIFASAVFFGSLFLSHEAQTWLASIALISCGIAITIGSVWMTITARRRLLITAQMVTIAGCLWGVIDIVIVYECLRQPVAQLPAAVFFTGVASLVVAPLAAAPLAVAWNRSR